MQNGQSRIVFLSVPESLRGRLAALVNQDEQEEHGGCESERMQGHEHGENEYGYAEGHEDGDFSGAFDIDPSIPIPVELPPGDTALDFDKLSWEMIVAGMLHVIAEGEAGSGDIDYYRRFVLSVKPNIMAEFTETAIFHAKNGNFDLAREILTVLLGLFPNAPELLLNLALVLEDRAVALERAGREGEAEAENERVHGIYREIIGLDPPFPNGLFNAGFFYLKKQGFSKAKECFSAYLPVADNPAKKEKARVIIREISGRSLDDEIFREAYDFIRLGEEQKGMERIRDFLDRHPSVWNGWFILGWALRRLGRWEDGAASFRKAVELGGGNSDTRNELAICLMELGDYASARKELELALREEPENTKIISNLGVLALKRGESGEAAGFFRTVLEFEPDDPIAKSYLGE
ncbi:MAG: tetratricopeptide repeat protein [Spirochaetaceae bacterium]|jgi:tetratricopeptide (TPR) repeat protein|nr:tetratricopeptide repeat protein [Spirochaetaceae bacterium]